MTKEKPKPVFFECGQCGHYHARDLPGHVDCRDNAHRFTQDQLDERYGPTGGEEITLEDQERSLEDGDVK